MIIECERCRKKFRIDDSLIKSSGTRVRCSKCGNVFWVEKDDAIAHQESEQSSAPENPSVDSRSPTPADLFSDLTRAAAESQTSDDASEIQEKSTGVKRESPSGFNWENIALDLDAETPSPAPKKFLDPPPPPKEEPPPRKDPEPIVKSAPSRLTVDMEKLTTIKRENSAFTPPPSQSIARRIELNKAKSSGGSKIASILFLIVIAVVISAAGWVVAVNLGLVPDKSDFVSKILAKLPAKFDGKRLDSVVVSGSAGKWVKTKDGPAYLVRGSVVNKSGASVNYIKIKTVFTSQGNALGDVVVYAGNTLTEREIKTLSLKLMMLKLYRINGDVDFYNPKKLAGLNYGIENGESVPLFVLYPSKSELPEMAYEVSVVDFEKTALE